MIKTKIFTIINAKETLEKLGVEPVSVGTSFAIARLIKSVNSELEIYEKERIKLCEKFGEKDEKNNCFEIEKLKQNEFENAYNELINQDVEINCKKLDLRDEKIKISAVDLIKIEEFLEG